MTNEATVRKLRKLVDQHGAAKLAVALGYRDTRAISVWLAKGQIPRARLELVKTIVAQGLKGA